MCTKGDSFDRPDKYSCQCINCLPDMLRGYRTECDLKVTRKELKALKAENAELQEALKNNTWINKARDKAYAEAIGWTHAFCCAALDDYKDPRSINCGEILKKGLSQLKAIEGKE